MSLAAIRRRPKLFLTLSLFGGVILTLLYVNLTIGNSVIERQIAPDYGVGDPQFARTMNVLFGPSLVGGNHVTELLNGDEIFPPMLEAIRGARQTICFETFIYWSGTIGAAFAEALAERARAGVRVHVLLDFIGSARMEPELLERLEEAGCEVVRYHPPRWYTLSRLNNRTHRKLLIVDGRIGFTGGVGIGDEWLGWAQDPDHWRDTHFHVVGPVVAQMQATFMVNWIKTQAVVKHTEDYFPEQEARGSMVAQMFHSSPQHGSENLRMMYLVAIAAARERILLEQAYFVPDNVVTRALASAAARGVRVEVIVPGEHTDTPNVRRASRGRWGPLLEAGVRIYEYQPTNLHAKVAIVDGMWSSVGSANFDDRSFKLNDEANLNVYDAGFAAQLEATFTADLAQSLEITYEQWLDRPWTERVSGWFWGLFRSQM